MSLTLSSIYIQPLPTPYHNTLEGRLSISQQLLKVNLVPLSCLRRRVEGILLSTERIIPRRRSIRRPIRLTTRLNPHKRIGIARPGSPRRPDAETRALNIAPVTPLLAQPGNGIASRVDDSLTRHASRFEQGAECLHVDLFVLALVPLGVCCFGEFTRGEVPGVPAGDVGGDAADLLGGAGFLVGVGEFFGTGLWRGC